MAFLSGILTPYRYSAILNGMYYVLAGAAMDTRPVEHFLTSPAAMPTVQGLVALVKQVIADRTAEGIDTSGLSEEIVKASSWNAALEVARELATRPRRADWPYAEADSLEAIRATWDSELLRPVSPPMDVEERIRTAFLARVAGCVLGKAFDFDPTGAELRAVLEPAGEWPLSDYVTEATNALLPQQRPQWREIVRERIAWAAEDDDINYTILAAPADRSSW